MATPADEEALDRARLEIGDLADAFRAAAEPALRSTLQRRLEALMEARRSWWGRLDPDVREAFRAAADRAIDLGVGTSLRRLEDPDVWLSPLVAPGFGSDAEVGWDASFPSWVHGLIRRLSPRRSWPRVESLDDPGNRIWLALVASARPLDPVLEEFGLEPSSVPSLGGGRYGLQPKTTEQLDPTGELSRLWGRYRLAHQRFVALSQAHRPATG
jgi:hypothetical protein